MTRVSSALICLLVLTGCFSHSDQIQVGLVVQSPAYPRHLAWPSWPTRVAPDHALDHDCYVLNVDGPGILHGVPKNQLPDLWEPQCLRLGSLSSTVSRAKLLSDGLTVTTRSGPNRRVELLGIKEANGITCQDLDPRDWFTGIPARLHVLGATTRDLRSSTSLTLSNLYLPQSPEDKIAPCAPPSTVTGISPTAGNSAGGTPVLISGTGFLQDPSVSIGNVNCAQALTLSDTQVTCVTGEAPIGNADVTVTNRGGDGKTLTNGYSFGPGFLSAWNFIESQNPTTEGLGVNPNGTPGAAEVVEAGGRLWLLWKERDELHLRRFGGNYFDPVWPHTSGDQPLVADVSTPPEVVVFDNKITAAYKDSSSKIRVGHASPSGWEFIDGGGLNGTPPPPAVTGASLAALDGKLYAAYVETGTGPENFARLMQYDGSSWSPVMNDQSELDQEPVLNAGDIAIAAHNSEIFVAWTEDDASDFILKVHRYNPGTSTWGTSTAALNATGGEDASAPHLYSDGSELYLAWEETTGGGSPPTVIQAANFNNGLWPDLTATTGLKVVSNAKQPRIVTFGSTAYLTWFEVIGTQHVYAFVNSAGTTWDNTLPGSTPLNFSPFTDAQNPRPSVAGNAIHVAFTQRNPDTHHDIRVTRGQ